MKTNSDFAVQLARNDFTVFCRSIMHQKVGTMHREMIKSAEDKSKHSIIEAARGHFKTTIMSVCYPLWTVWRGAEKADDIVTVGATEEQGIRVLDIVKRKIEETPLLREALYPDSSRVWSKTELELKNGWRIKTLPFSDAIRGNHPGRIILDDILKDQTTNVEEVDAKFWGIVYPALQAKRAKLVLVGTPMSYLDLFHKLGGLTGTEEERVARREEFAFLKFPAIKDDGTPQFPEHYSLEHLMKIKRSMPANLWAREMMCEPISGANALFPETSVKACVNQVLPEVAQERLAASSIVIGYDVAVTDKEGSDYSAYVVIRVRPDNQPLEVIDVQRYKLPSNEQLKHLETLVARYRPAKILIETTGVGAGLFQVANSTSKLVGIVEAFETKMKSKQELLGLLEVTIRNQAVKLPFNRDLLDELAGWENTHDKQGKPIVKSVKAHDDLVMALAFSVWAAREYGFDISAFGVDRAENNLAKFGELISLPNSTIKSAEGIETIDQSRDDFDPGWENLYTYG